MDDSLAIDDRSARLAVLCIAVVVLLSLGPLLLEPLCCQRPLQLGFLSPYTSVWATWSTKAAVVTAIAVCVWLYHRNHPTLTLWHIVFCMAVAGAMTAMHWFRVDRNPQALAWQTMVYTHVLNHQDVTPHNLRPLPYGLVRLLEGITRDWTFSCVAYRWFFTLWFLCASYQFARLWISAKMSYLVVAILGALYHYSIKTYLGQLTDPMSHWLFVLALRWAVENRWLPLAIALAAGILAKETAMLIVPAYLACAERRGWPELRRTAALGAVCAVAFLSVRLPYGWFLRYQQINGTGGSMLWLNLKVFKASFPHLVRFFLVFIPFIAYGWRSLDGRLRSLCLTVVPLVLISNFWFGWVHESRNYMPLVPILATAGLTAFQRAAKRGKLYVTATPGAADARPTLSQAWRSTV
jgi:hypothetical protein